MSADAPWAGGWSRAQYEEEAGAGKGLFAVLDDGEVRGFFILRRVDPEAQLVDIVVRPADRGQGMGRALLEGAVAAARSWGSSKLTLEVGAANAPALRLYERAGFRIVGRRPKFYNDRSDAILMDRDLS
jgi:ribosomal-protein-alanine N-acetyltransferase